MDQEPDDGLAYAALTAHVVAAYVSNNPLAPEDVAALIASTHAALSRTAPVKADEWKQEPAVPINRSIKAHFVTCLECGKKFKSLKRHLRADHDLTAEAYRAKWGLRFDYPVTAPAYSLARSEMAKSMGLGGPATRLKSRSAANPAAEASPASEPANERTGRPGRRAKA